MDSQNKLDATLISNYRSAALSRRAKSKLNTEPSDSGLRFLNRNGIVTVPLSNAKHVSGYSDRQKNFGRSNIQIPEYRWHRKQQA